MPGEGPDLSVVIVTYRSLTDLPACLLALPGAVSSLRMEVIVVDNASDDGTLVWLRQHHPDVTVLANAENVGFARAVNQGAAGARGRHLLLLNPDARPGPESVARLVARLDGEPTLGLAAPALTDFEGRPVRSAWPEQNLITALFESLGLLLPGSRWHQARPDRAGKVPCVPGTSLAIRADCFRALGGLDEGFFLYHEDFDLCLRARAAGWGVVLTENATVAHRMGGSAFQDRRSFVLRFEESRRRLIVKHNHGLRRRALVVLQELGLGRRAGAAAVRYVVRRDPAELEAAGHAREALRALRRGSTGHN